jgi:hypothetical protein
LNKTGRPIHKSEIGLEELRSIAIEENYTAGKWEIHISWSKADQYWQMLIKDFLNRKFPEGVISIKIKCRNEVEEQVDDNSDVFQAIHSDLAVILVVNDDWTDEETTLNIGKLLQSYKMETLLPLTYFPNVRSAIRMNKTFKNVKFPELYELST